MKYELPDSKALLELAENDPEALERIRKEATEDPINDAPESCQQRMKGLQFQIDMEIRRSKSPLESCIRVSRMMHNTLWQFRDVMQQTLGAEPLKSKPPFATEQNEEKPTSSAKILQFDSYS